MTEGAAAPIGEETGAGMRMLAMLFGEETVEQAHASGRAQLEAAAERLRVAILAAEPMSLLGYLWAQLLLGRLATSADEAGAQAPDCISGHDETVVLALEYIHAVLSGQPQSAGQDKQEQAFVAVVQAAQELRDILLRYCLVAAAALPGVTDMETRTQAMHAMTGWAMLRGHRYQSLEEEFFSFVLAPHEDALQAAYAVGAAEIARGIQAAVDAMRYGHMHAFEQLSQEMSRTHAAAEAAGSSLEEAIATLYANDEAKQAVRAAVERLFFGGICDVGSTSGLPATVLDDLAFGRGQETDFFAPGPLRGTPMRRLPARERPLLRLDDAYYACDPNFLRDSAYRAIQWGLGRRVRDYEKTQWGVRQMEVTESAFPRILAHQLRDATVLSTVYYPDPDTGDWVENDLVILIDDALLQVEVKAGVMPMHSPEMHFDRHMRTVQNLIVKAKQQSERFFRYAASAAEVPLYQLKAGRYIEVHRLQLGKCRLAVPIGLTIEAFTPFSAMSKRLPQMAPILGQYPFVSMSVDDLFVLKRVLPTTGELMHYLLVRQRVAAQVEAALIDEIDHLGAYVTHNRVDAFNEEQFAQGANLLTHAAASDVIDDYFGDPDFAAKPPPSQSFPPLLVKFLQANEVARRPTFLAADAAVRDFGAEGRQQLQGLLEKLVPTLNQHPFRWALLGGQPSTFIWMQRNQFVDTAGVMQAKAEAALLGLGQPVCQLLVIYVDDGGGFAGGAAREVQAPTAAHPAYAQRLREGQEMMGRSVRLD